MNLTKLKNSISANNNIFDKLSQDNFDFSNVSTLPNKFEFANDTYIILVKDDFVTITSHCVETQDFVMINFDGIFLMFKI